MRANLMESPHSTQQTLWEPDVPLIWKDNSALLNPAEFVYPFEHPLPGRLPNIPAMRLRPGLLNSGREHPDIQDTLLELHYLPIDGHSLSAS